ncbi:MAG: mandelate racemase/muconate lactonizing enzyme family protein [Chloroflexi bacterium]|nr:mandelate racemase/muconate lactonizing enzyme family protein [Chloroflexota bacterium]
MKITDVRVHAGYAEAFRQNVTLVQLVTDGGVDGWGDFGLSGKSGTVADCVRQFAAWLVGEDPFRIEHIWQDLFRGSFWRGGPVIMTAISAIDTALWDLKGKALGAPVYDLLGGLARKKVRVYRHQGPPTSDEAKRRLDALLEAGFTAFRTSTSDREYDARGGYSPKRAIEHSVEAVRALREYVGPEHDVCIDVHTRLGPMEAIELCQALEPYKPFFVEDPIRSENPEVFRLVRSKTKTRLATGEQLCGKWVFRELISENLVDYLRIDLCHVGGITETRKLANWAEAYYVETALHVTNGHLSDVASMHVDLSIPNCGIQEYSGASRPVPGLIEGGFTIDRGHLVPTGEPGLGLRINEAALANLAPLRDGMKTRWRREDGAVQDW